MIDDCPRADRILVAQLTGEARLRAWWRDLTEDEGPAAVTLLRDLACGRADLLAEVAGVLEGTEGEMDQDLVRQAAGPVLIRRSRPGGGPGMDRGGPPPRRLAR